MHITPSAAEPDVDVDDIFEVLSNRRRRFVVHILKKQREAVEVGEIAEKVAAWENGISIAEVTGKMTKERLHGAQTDTLPKMNDIGIVEFRKDRGVVLPTELLSDLDVYLDIVYGRDISWSKYYLGLTAIAATLTFGIHLGVWPFAAAPFAWGIAFVTAMAFSVVSHEWYNRQTKLGIEESPPEYET